MKTRLLTSLYIAIALVLAFASRFFTLYVFDALVGLFAVVGAVEIARVLERSKKFSSIILVGLYPAAMYVGLFIAFFYQLSWWYYLLFFVGVYLLFFVASFVLTLLNKKETTRIITKYELKQPKWRFALDCAFNTGFVGIYPSLMFMTLILLNHFAQLPNVTKVLPNNANLLATFFLLLAVVVTVCCDSLAMITGMIFKGPKLAPIISPKKTISGAIGGLVGGTLSGMLLFYFFSLNGAFLNAFARIGNIWTVFFISLLASVLCQAGDLFASYLKRRARVKDYGTIFPGHGGVMDRYDGLVFTSTFVFISVLVLLILV